MFLTTLFLGGLLTLVTSFIVKSDAYANVFQPLDLYQLIGPLLFFLGLGFIFSVISQMGFFAYLTVHQFGLGIFRGYWPIIQVGLVIFTLFDLVYFRYRAADNTSLWPYLFTAMAILLIGLVVAYLKTKETNQKAFIPALFFMVVVTTVEWVPALQAKGNDYTWLMIIPLLACNIYQLLLLHKLNPPRTQTTK
nr:KinB-signaling pathway activation protein [Thalassobacillus sp. CUG 92003]